MAVEDGGEANQTHQRAGGAARDLFGELLFFIMEFQKLELDQLVGIQFLVNLIILKW
ncbi:MAG: hypothetical protein MUD01_27545 [Chloroflexaceae bacterium]|nr:hypothetical protein [Chloroflexaceae bacterium]